MYWSATGDRQQERQQAGQRQHLPKGAALHPAWDGDRETLQAQELRPTEHHHPQDVHEGKSYQLSQK